MGVTNTAGMFLLILNSQNTKATTFSVLKSISVLFYFASDIFIFHQAFSLFQVVGAIIILTANFLSVHNKIQQEKL